MGTIETDPIAVLANLHKRRAVHTHVKGNTNTLFSLLASLERPMSPQDVMRDAEVHRSYGSFVLNTLTELGLVAPQPRMVNNRYYKVWQASERLVELCENYNALFADELRSAIPPGRFAQKVTPTFLVGIALENFTNAYKAQLRPEDHDITSWAQRELGLHPEQTTRVALGALANQHFVDMNARFTELVEAHIASRTEGPRIPLPRTDPDLLPGVQPVRRSAEV